jgi:hypothetical protein
MPTHLPPHLPPHLEYRAQLLLLRAVLHGEHPAQALVERAAIGFYLAGR